jgi:FkbM family methyltransferase
MWDKIRILKEKGYVPDTVLDIGAHHGHWTKSMKTIYGSARYVMFEAIPYAELAEYSQRESIPLYTVILNETAKDVEWYEMRNTGDSMFKELTCHFVHCTPSIRPSVTLDSIVDTSIPLKHGKNVFIKIDCQGAEIPILKGSSSILQRTDFILLEIPLFGQYNKGVPTFLEHIQYMDSIGFVPFDIVDTHYVRNYNIQIDMLFINKSHSFNVDVNKVLM